jgi:hypothetical protein
MQYEKRTEEKLPNGNTIKYKVLNGTAYHEDTPDAVVTILDNALASHRDTSLRFCLGDVETGRDWGEWRAVPGHYQRQVQWQLYVTGATSCVFGWMLRTTRQGDMVPAWPGPKFVVVNRDEALIERLIVVAENLYRELPLASS